MSKKKAAKAAPSRVSAVLYILILFGFLLGVLLGVFCPQIFPPIAFLGTIYVKLLKLLVIPLLMAGIVVAVSSTVKRFAGRLLRVLLLFIGMFVVSFCLTAVFVSVLKPGVGVSFAQAAEWDGTLASTGIGDFFLQIIPDNLFAAMTSGSMLPCILFSFVCGIAASAVKADKFVSWCEDVERIFTKILGYVMFITPLGVFALMGNAVAENGAALLGDAFRYILIAWAGCAIITLLVMILPVWIFAKINPFTYIRRVAKVWLISLSTCSSAATMPHTIRVCNEEFGVSEDITGIVVPLGCTIHMCGGAVSFCLLGLYTLQASGIPLTVGLFLYMLLIATLMNMAAPGIPGGGIVLGATYLTALGAPTLFIGIYSGIYRLLDMAYTTVNVTGDITANILLSAGEEQRAKDRHPAR